MKTLRLHTHFAKNTKKRTGQGLEGCFSRHSMFPEMIDSPQKQVKRLFQSLDMDISTDQSSRAHCALGCSSAVGPFLGYNSIFEQKTNHLDREPL